MRHGSLFNGIGGFQLAAHWMGWKNAFHCEIDRFCNQVVHQHFPESICYEDIKDTDFAGWRGKIDIISGGFPCQPYSSAGKRLGKEDERHLWPEMLRAVREVRPAWVVGENVRGLVNWNGGMVFDEVQSDLEAEGYEVASFLLPACSVEGFHNRDRIWIIGFKDVAYDTDPNGNGLHRKEVNEYRSIQRGVELRNEQVRLPGSLVSQGVRDGTDARIFRGPNGLSHRVDRIKALGNAIVPQVALEIFQAIDNYEKLIHTR